MEPSLFTLLSFPSHTCRCVADWVRPSSEERSLQRAPAFQEKSQNQQAWNSFLTWLHLRLLIITWTDNSIAHSIASSFLPSWTPTAHCPLPCPPTSPCLPLPPPTTNYTAQTPTSLAPTKKLLTTPTIITVMAVWELVTWLQATSPSTHQHTHPLSCVLGGHRTWFQGVWWLTNGQSGLVIRQRDACRECGSVPWWTIFSVVGGEGGGVTVTRGPTNNSASVGLELNESDECVKSGEWLN